jgi:hypothetical protein
LSPFLNQRITKTGHKKSLKVIEAMKPCNEALRPFYCSNFFASVRHFTIAVFFKTKIDILLVHPFPILPLVLWQFNEKILK